MEITEIKAKTILSKLRFENDTFFGSKYNMNVYRGCTHACIYCDSRSECYQLGALDYLRVKINAPELLAKELSSKKVKGTIGTGSMNDPYMPIEAKLKIIRQCLDIIRYYAFPVHVMTKSTLVCRDIDILHQISKRSYAAVSITITTADDGLSKIIEPGAPPSSLRFKAIKELSDAGIYCGISFMPVLPYINDTLENYQQIIEKASNSGAKYILAVHGLTQRKGQREYFHEKLREINPDLQKKYEKQFGKNYYCLSPKYNELNQLFIQECQKFGIDTKMKHYKSQNESLQYDLF